MNDMTSKKQRLLEIIREEAVVTGKEKRAVMSDGRMTEEDSWLLDFRNIFLNPEALELIVEIFWEIHEADYPFQVGGQEVAAIPLVSAIVLHSQKIGRPVNGFFIRKGRKPAGLQKIIEGKLNKEKIILIDDLANSGGTILRQNKVLEYAGIRASKAFVLVNFKAENEKTLSEEGIPLSFLYTPHDIGLKTPPTKPLPLQEFKNVWHFQGGDPAYFLRVPKSSPALDEEKIYFGGDDGNLWALDQKDGSVAWKFDQLGYPTADKKIILSSPALYKDTLYFGAYDGNFYAIDKKTGQMKWRNMDADHIGSSPDLAPDLGIVFIGQEFGVWKKKGGLAALDMKTGEKIWEYSMPEFTHCSPTYCPEKKLVACGCNDGCAYLFDAKVGKLKWKFQTSGPLKASFVFNMKRNLIIFGSHDQHIYALDIDSGEVKGQFHTKGVIYSTPLIHGNTAYFGSMDKHLYSLDLDSGKLNWHTDCDSRLFAQPQMIEGKIYIGGTGGIMHEINPDDGKITGRFIATERITNKVVYNPKTKRFFLPTYANEIYCLEKKN